MMAVTPAPEEFDFPLDEPPTMPERTRSGRLHTKIIVSLGKQMNAEKRANWALDKLIVLLRDIGMFPEVPKQVVEETRRSTHPALVLNLDRSKK